MRFTNKHENYGLWKKDESTFSVSLFILFLLWASPFTHMMLQKKSSISRIMSPMNWIPKRMFVSTEEPLTTNCSRTILLSKLNSDADLQIYAILNYILMFLLKTQKKLDDCIVNPTNCPDGFSMSIWEKVNYGDKVLNIKATHDKFFVYSTGKLPSADLSFCY